jgi:hypothetical protein
MHPPSQASAVRLAPDNTGSLNHIAIAIGDPDDFVAIRAALIERGLAGGEVHDAQLPTTRFAPAGSRADARR